MQEKKWGLYDITGKQILPIEYDEIGCTEKTKTIAKQTTINSNIAIIVFLLYFIDITYLYLIDLFYYTTINGRKKEMVTHFLFSNFFDSSSFTR